MQNQNRVRIISPAPVLNTPDFSLVFGGRTGSEIPLNERGHPFHYEFVGLEGMVFETIEQRSSFIFHVKHSHYRNQNLYLDSRFFCSANQEFTPAMPSKEIILARMAERIGMPYVWGGNWCEGIPELLTLYPPQHPLDKKMETLWTWKGIDCSGLLFEASRGATPRNTSALVNFGKPLTLSNLSLDKVVEALQPLDMIVYPGHVLFVYDSQRTIESKFPYGVIYRQLKERLMELFSERKLVDTWHPSLSPAEYFIIRRF